MNAIEKNKMDYALLQNKLSYLDGLPHLSAAQKDLKAEIENKLDELRAECKPERLTIENRTLSGNHRGETAPYALRGPNAKKDYKALFGSAGPAWDHQGGGFFASVLSGRHDPRLVKNGSMTETIPSDGGFLVPTEYAAKIHSVSLENELVLPRAFVQPMISSEIKIPGMSIGNHGTALMGGFTASYTAETSTISEANPKTRSMTLHARKLTGLLRFSAELAQDTPGGEQQIINLCGQGLGWYRDQAFLKGTGAGQPLGILNSDCLVEVSPEDGQAADSIVYSNLTKMLSRLYSGSFKNAVWVCHQSTIPRLLELSIAVGTGGSNVPVLSETDGQFKILTRPVLFTEKTEPLGSKGDIMLCDFTQFVVGLRAGMRFDTSIHPGFLTDEIYARIIERHDGQPLWDEALTLADGETTVSPFVVLGAR